MKSNLGDLGTRVEQVLGQGCASLRAVEGVGSQGLQRQKGSGIRAFKLQGFGFVS